eukprot:jgi/Ulvmu1/6182/UM028_0038.1
MGSVHTRWPQEPPHDLDRQLKEKRSDNEQHRNIKLQRPEQKRHRPGCLPQHSCIAHPDLRTTNCVMEASDEPPAQVLFAEELRAAKERLNLTEAERKLQKISMRELRDVSWSTALMTCVLADSITPPPKPTAQLENLQAKQVADHMHRTRNLRRMKLLYEQFLGRTSDDAPSLERMRCKLNSSMAHRVQPAQTALHGLFSALLSRAHAAQRRRHVLTHQQSSDVAYTPTAPFPAGQGTGHLQHDIELAAALADGEDTPDAGRDGPVDRAGKPAGAGKAGGCATDDQATELECYQVAEAATNLAAVLINHTLQQCKLHGACAWTRGHPISSVPKVLNVSAEPEYEEQENLFRFLLVAPGHGLLRDAAPFCSGLTDPVAADHGDGAGGQAAPVAVSVSQDGSKLNRTRKARSGQKREPGITDAMAATLPASLQNFKITWDSEGCTDESEGADELAEAARKLKAMMQRAWGIGTDDTANSQTQRPSDQGYARAHRGRTSAADPLLMWSVEQPAASHSRQSRPSGTHVSTSGAAHVSHGPAGVSMAATPEPVWRLLPEDTVVALLDTIPCNHTDFTVVAEAQELWLTDADTADRPGAGSAHGQSSARTPRAPKRGSNAAGTSNAATAAGAATTSRISKGNIPQPACCAFEMEATPAMIDLFQRWPSGCGPPSIILPHHILRLFLKRRTSRESSVAVQSASPASSSVRTKLQSAFSRLPETQPVVPGHVLNHCLSTWVGQHGTHEPVFQTAADAGLIAPLPHLSDAVSWRIAKQWSMRPLNMWSGPTISGGAQMIRTGLNDRCQIAILSGHTIPVDSYESMITKLEVALDSYDAAAVAPVAVSQPPSSSSDADHAWQAQQNYSLRALVGKGVKVRRGGCATLCAAGYSTAGVQALKTHAPVDAQAQGAAEDASTLGHIPSVPAAGSHVHSAQPTAAGEIYTHDPASFPLGRWRLRSRIKQPPESGSQARDDSSNTHDEPECSQEASVDSDWAESDSDPDDIPKMAGRKRKLDNSRKADQPMQKIQRRRRGTSAQQPAVITPPAEQPGDPQGAAAPQRTINLIATLATRPRPAIQSRVNQIGEHHNIRPHESVRETIDGWSAKQLEANHKRRPEAKVHRLLSSIKAMDGDSELGIENMQNDVKLIFRGCQAAGVPFTVLQRAAARMTRIMGAAPHDR